jgi:hypothetical protein
VRPARLRSAFKSLARSQNHHGIVSPPRKSARCARVPREWPPAASSTSTATPRSAWRPRRVPPTSRAGYAGGGRLSCTVEGVCTSVWYPPRRRSEAHRHRLDGEPGGEEPGGHEAHVEAHRQGVHASRSTASTSKPATAWSGTARSTASTRRTSRASSASTAIPSPAPSTPTASALPSPAAGVEALVPRQAGREG